MLGACVALAWLSARSASADLDFDEASWRRGARAAESPQRFAFEIRVGPYTPKIDDEFPVEKPYETVFGTDSRVLFGLELDWQILRIPRIGSFGPGIGWGYTHMTGKALKIATNEPSVANTTLGIMPMYGVGVLRVDVLARETAIPLVGYGKAGIGYGLWWAGNELEVQERGHSWGTQFALGGMLLLDAFDEHAAIEIDNEWGINNSYFFFEWMSSNLSGFGANANHSVLQVGANTWTMGLALEM